MTSRRPRTVAQIKLAELERQHHRLAAHYAAVEAEALAEADPARRFGALDRGLAATTFAGRPLHPEVANLDAVRLEVASGAAAPATLAAWTEHLARELARGRRRAGAAYLFGLLLDERAWDRSAVPGDDAAREDHEERHRETWDAADPPWDAAALGALVARLAGAPGDDARARFAVAMGAAVSVDEARGHLGALARDPDLAQALRDEARAAAASDASVSEHAGAVTILLDDVASWDWPDDAFPVRARWRRTRWRAFLDLDLVTALFLEVVGVRWGVHLRRAWLDPLAAGAGPAPLSDTVDHWRDAARRRLVLADVPDQLGQYSRFVARGYGGATLGADRDAWLELLLALDAEVAYARAVAPERPVYVVQTDLRECFASLPHDALLLVAEAAGATPPWLDLLRRYLRGPFLQGTQLVARRRGVFPGQSLARVLADALLALLDAHVRREAGVRPLRYMDDVYLVTPSREAAVRAWGALEGFAAAAGVAPHPAKTGAWCVGGACDLPLPARPTRWGFLALGADGAWSPDDAAVDDYARALARRLHPAQSVLATVAEYNDGLAHLVRGLAPLAPLGEGHVARVARAVGRVHGGLFAGTGVVAALRERVARRFPDAAGDEGAAPDAWFHWPVTAGGLGLQSPACLLAAAARAQREHRLPAAPPRRDADPECQRGAWMIYYHTRAFARLALAAPSPSPALDGLLADFIARGGEVQGRPQKSLGVYWRWVLHTHGPRLLDAFGTFRFLVHELVPLGLVSATRLAPEAGEGEGEGDGDDIPF